MYRNSEVFEIKCSVGDLLTIRILGVREFRWVVERAKQDFFEHKVRAADDEIIDYVGELRLHPKSPKKFKKEIRKRKPL